MKSRDYIFSRYRYCESHSFLKHRVGVSVNAESARYKELKEDKILIPRDLPMEWQKAAFSKEGLRMYHECIEELKNMFTRNRAKEVARYFRTYNANNSRCYV